LVLLSAVAIVAGPGGRREIPVERFVTGLFETTLKAGEILVAVRVPRLSARARCGYWKFCRKMGEFPQAIGGALDDPERGAARAVMGALRGAPYVVADARALLHKPDDAACGAVADAAGIGDDVYARQLHAVALKRAVNRLTQ
jgi:carbon-monoxide dehydrogenase medium subunit